MKRTISILIFLLFIKLLGFSQPIHVSFSTIPKAGTILIYAHQDDDLLWMLPFWNISEKFIGGAMPATQAFRQIVDNQQDFLDNSTYNIPYKANWIYPFGEVTNQEYSLYYHQNDQTYNYLSNDHLTAFWDEGDTVRVKNEVNKIKSKIEPYIANPSTQRIITHNIWGEYGHQHHRAVNAAVRELAVKYRKDVWMLGADNGDFIDIDLPSDITYTIGGFDTLLFNGIRDIYLANSLWTWPDINTTPYGDHNFIKIVDGGIDKTNVLTGDEVTYPGPTQNEPGSYIFDGLDDYISLPGNNYLTFSISLKVRPDQISEMDISKMTEYPSFTSSNKSFFMQSDGRISARFYDSQPKTVTSTSQLTQSTWANLIMTGNGTILSLYINGTLQGTVEYGPSTSQYNSPEFILGQAQETASSFIGQISDVRLFDYVLTENEILDLAGTTPPSTFTINASTGFGGVINPSGIIMVNRGSNRSFTFTPIPNYQIFDVLVDSISVGALSSYTFNNVTSNHTISVSFSPLPSISLNKPATSQSFQYGFEASKANDSDGLNSYWSTDPYPQWWRVDLGDIYDINTIVIANRVSLYRYYHYNIQISNDGQTYTQIINKSDNTWATENGDTYSINATGRYIRVNINYNSSNTGTHISDFRVYGILNPNYHKIIASAGNGGTISPTGEASYMAGTNPVYTITPNFGYRINEVIIDGESQGPLNSYQFVNITAAHTISASFIPIPSIALNKPATTSAPIVFGNLPYRANDEDQTNTFWSSPTVSQWWKVDLGDVYDVTGAIVRNYFDNIRYYNYVIEASIDDIIYTPIGEKTNNNPATSAGDNYPLNVAARFLRVTILYNSSNTGSQIADFRVFGSINPNYHNITATAGTGGTINPSAVVSLLSGTNQTYSISSNFGYNLTDVIVDGQSMGAINSYIFENVTIAHTISAVFTPLPSIALNKPTSSSGEHVFGNLSHLANDEDINTFWSTPTAPEWWKVDLGDAYDITGIIIRNYIENQRYYNYLIEASIDDVNYTQIAAKTDNNPANILGDNYILTSTTRYIRVTITNNSSNTGCQISDFRVFGEINPNYFSITSSSGSGGTITPSGLVVAAYGASQTYNITPGVGFFVSDILVDDVSQGASTSYTFSNITSDHTINAIFAPLASIALNKTATAQSFEYIGVGPTMANDPDGSNASYWAAEPYPQWWKVDLGNVYDINGIIIRNFVDNNRYYQYVIEGSIDDVNYNQIVEKSNTNIAIDAGDAYSTTTTARFIRVRMILNSLNSGVHISDFRVFGTLNTNYHLITASAGVGGSINPPGVVAVLNGTGQTYNILPFIGYRIDEVRIDNVPVGPVSSYSFTNVTSSHSISVTYAALPSLALNKTSVSQSNVLGYDASFANDANGSNDSHWAASPYPQWWKVDLGEIYDLDAIVIRNYADNFRYYHYTIEASNDDLTYIELVSKSDNTQATDSGNSYHVNSPARYLRVNISYNSLNSGTHISDFRVYGKYRINATAGVGGTINPSGITSLTFNSSQNYTITPNPGFRITDVLVDQVSVGAVSSYTFSNISSNHSISAVFTPTFIINSIAGSGGTITPSGSIYLNQGSNQTYSITPNTGFRIAMVRVDNVQQGSISSYSFNNITANHTITASFIAIDPNNIALNKPASAQLSQTGREPSFANDSDGSNNSYWAASPYSKWWRIDLGAIYDITSLVIRNYTDGSRYYQYFIYASADDVTYTQVAAKINRNVATNEGDMYNLITTARFIRVNMTYSSANMGVAITDFRVYGTPAVGLPTYTIVANSGSNGTINPAGILTVSQGTSQTYTIIPNSGYMVSNLILDGVPIGQLSSYTFNYINSNHSLTAQFSPLSTYTISSNAGIGGTISPVGSSIYNQGSSITYTIIPSTGYNISNIIVDGISIGRQSSYTFNNISANHTIEATFIPYFTIVGRAGEGGVLSPYDEVFVNQNGTQIFTITPNEGYLIEEVTVDGVSMGQITSYTFNNITEDHVITATFSAVNIIVARSSEGGTITPSDEVMVRQFSDQTFLIAPDIGYTIEDVIVDGISFGPLTSYTFANIISDHTISAIFGISAGSKGSSSATSVNKASGSVFPRENITVNVMSIKNNEEIKISTFPNPFSDYLIIRIDSPLNELFDILITDISGRVKYSYQKAVTNQDISIYPHLNPGLYILTATNKNTHFNTRIIKR